MMQRFCEECGAKRLEHHRFCTSCGKAFVTSVTELEGDIEPADSSEREPQANSETSELEGQTNVQEFVGADNEISDWEVPQKSKSIWPLAILILVLIAGTSSWFIWGRGAQSEMADVVVTGSANVRDRPTSIDSKIVAKFEKGKELTGRWVDGPTDSSEQWLEFKEAGRTVYIWKGNLETKDSPVPSQSKASLEEGIEAVMPVSNVHNYHCRGMTGRKMISTLDADKNLVTMGIPGNEFMNEFHIVNKVFREHKNWYEIRISGVPTGNNNSVWLVPDHSSKTMIIYDLFDEFSCNEIAN